MLQIKFKIAHIAGSVNPAADFLYRLELNVAEKIRLKIREDIQTTRIEVTTSSSAVADEELIFFTQADTNDESEEQTLERKSNRDKMRRNGQQTANHLLRKQVLKNSQNRRKHNVAFNERNQSKCTNTSRARC